MNYINLSVAAANDPSMLAATNEQVGVWFRLLAYCHAQMNGGAITGCGRWVDDMWMRAAGVRGGDVAGDSPLWHYSGDCLVVHLYDRDAEETYRRKQRLGKEYALKRWTARNDKVVQLPKKPQKAATA